MMNTLSLYYRYLVISVKGQLQYRVSFILQMLGQFLITLVEFIGVWALFRRFNNINGWSLAEVALFYGVVNVSFACAEVLGRGFESFATTVKSGNFDRFLLRPRSTILQLFGVEFSLKRVGKFLQGLIILFWSINNLNLELNLIKTLLLLATIASGCALFLGLIIIQATICFWTIESLEMMNILTYGGVETAQYPISIYNKWLANFFTFIVPLAAVSFFPLLAVLDRAKEFSIPILLCYLAPLAGFLFLALALKVWHIGEQYYCSSGS
jgi:ABC-2 type transport system permease protein